MSSSPLFNDEELEAIESIITEYGPQWVETAVEGRLIESVLAKLEALLND